MTEPTESEIDAAAKAIQSDVFDERFEGWKAWSINVARAALTAAAQVRQNARDAIVDECEEVFQPGAHRLGNTDSISPALMPIYSATEDQGEDVPGMRKGEE